jgi:hypothetical protein
MVDVFTDSSSVSFSRYLLPGLLYYRAVGRAATNQHLGLSIRRSLFWLWPRMFGALSSGVLPGDYERMGLQSTGLQYLPSRFYYSCSREWFQVCRQSGSPCHYYTYLVTAVNSLWCSLRVLTLFASGISIFNFHMFGLMVGLRWVPSQSMLILLPLLLT